MDFTNNRKENDRPVQASPVGQPSPVGAARPAAGPAGSRPGKLVPIVVAVLVVVVLAVAAWLLVGKRSGAVAIDEDSYQAVFLTNGQVYFGDLKNADGDYLTMENIYYLQVQQELQPGDKKDDKADSQSNNVQLVKLGNELHGPQDAMQISSKQVLFWENLKDDGKVAKAMKEYKAE